MYDNNSETDCYHIYYISIYKYMKMNRGELL